MTRGRVVIALLAAAWPAALPAQDEPVRPATPERKVGGPVALVLRGSGALVECAVSGDGSTAVLYTADEMLHFYHLPDRLGGAAAAAGKNDKAFRYKIRRLQLTHDGQRLFGAIDGATIAALTRGPKILHHLRGNAGMADFALHSDGQTLAAGLQGGIVRIWDAQTGKPQRYVQAHDRDIQSIAFSFDGRLMITAATDRKLRFFSYPACGKVGEAELDGPVVEMYLARDGKTLVTFESRNAQVWDLTSYKPGRRFESKVGIVQVGVSNDGKQLAIAEVGGAVTLHDLTNGKSLARWDAHPEHTVVCLRFVEPVQGRRLLVTAASGDDAVGWDLARLLGKGPGKSPSKRRRR